jgi:V8-like Glu-specific endopeptidase
MILLGALSALLLSALPAGAAAAGSGPGQQVDPSGVRAYWTAARMQAAVPLQGAAPSAAAAAAGAGAAPPALDRDQVADPSDQPYRSHGKVFLTISGGEAPGDYLCSGTAVAAPAGAGEGGGVGVVWTAGHCVFDTDGGGYASNWMFAPAYEDGATPFGEWPASQLAALDGWRSGGNLAADLGAAIVGPDRQGRSLAELVGGRGIGFNQPRKQAYMSFGYPAVAPPLEFDGERLFRCSSTAGVADDPPGPGPRTLSIPCDMTAGSSGGGWVADGGLLSVSSYSYCDEDGCELILYGPYQGDNARALYRSLVPEAEFCNGRQVTIVGGPGAEKLVGTSAPDVFKARGGADRIVGRGGNDTACGGGGADVLVGKGGSDELFGNGGADKLRGGPGKDICNGGKGRDRARGCETVSGAA